MRSPVEQETLSRVSHFRADPPAHPPRSWRDCARSNRSRKLPASSSQELAGAQDI